MASKIPFTFELYKGADLIEKREVSSEVPGVIKIGKLESSHLRIDDDDVSRMHAVIEITDPSEIHIIDLGSANGTVVNGEKVNKAKIGEGDELTLGETRVVVRVGAATKDVAPAATQTPAPGPVPPGPGPAMVPPPGVVPPMGMAAPQIPPPGAVGGQPVAPAPMQAYVPQPDPSLDRQDGSRAIEVTGLFEDSVVSVRHLDNPQAGKVSALTWAVIGIGWGVAAVGLVLALIGQGGFGGLLAVLGTAVGLYGVDRMLSEKRSPHFALGPSIKADVHIQHEALRGNYFPLVMSSGSSYGLLFTEQMNGDVTLGADQTPLSALVDSGRATRNGKYNAFEYPIPQDARIKLDFGDHTFLVNSVPPARTVISPFLARVNWSAQVSNGLSFAAHALLLFMVFAIPPDAKALSLDLFNADNKFVKYLVKPPEQKEEEVPEWLKKKGPDKAGGKGQKHKGEEGKMGKKTSKKKTGLYGLKGPKNAEPHLAKRLAEDAVKDAGVLGLLKSSSGSHIASIFGQDSALGNDAEDALGGLIGDTVGESYGLGGLGVAGTGRGGGGTGEGTIGLGTLGTIGKGGGGGSGAGYGRGAGRLGGRRARAPRVIAGRAQVRGALDKEIIRRIIRRHINEVKYCYQKELVADKRLGGRVIIQFTIAGTGQVVVSKVQTSTLGNKKVEMCIAQAVRRWLFPKPKGGGIVIVSYPFVLRAAGG